jgi:hypothetical protein
MELIGTIMVRRGSPYAEWKDTLVKASYALAHLDADRLEEMALSCAALVRDGSAAHLDAHRQAEPRFGEAEREVAIFARVLEATKTNLNVIRRVCARVTTQLEYGEARSFCGVSAEGKHGDH